MINRNRIKYLLFACSYFSSEFIYMKQGDISSDRIVTRCFICHTYPEEVIALSTQTEHCSAGAIHSTSCHPDCAWTVFWVSLESFHLLLRSMMEVNPHTHIDVFFKAGHIVFPKPNETHVFPCQLKEKYIRALTLDSGTSIVLKSPEILWRCCIPPVCDVQLFQQLFSAHIAELPTHNHFCTSVDLWLTNASHFSI